MSSFLQLIDAFSNSKGLNREVVLEALSSAHAKIIAKQFPGENPNIEVDLDLSTGGYSCFRTWLIVSDDESISEEDLGRLMPLSEAQNHSPDAQVSDELRIEIPGHTGRIEAHEFAHMLRRIVQSAVRIDLSKKYRTGQMLIGQVKRTARDRLIIQVTEQVDAVMDRSNMLPREIFRVGDKIRFSVTEVNVEGRGPLLVASRASKEMLSELFKVEVPELSEGSLEIRGVARDPGVRSKIAVKAIDTRIDPVGACVGIRGARVQAVTQELNGERIDICLWDDDLAQMVARALAPAEIESVSINEEDRAIDVIVAKEQLSLAIGRNGQNVRLAGDMLGWDINVMSQDQAEEKADSEDSVIISRLVDSLEIDNDIALILLREGFNNVETIAYIEQSEISEVEEFDENIAAELQERAKAYLLMLKVQSDVSGLKPDDSILELENMTQQVAFQLAEKGVCKCEELADMDVEELTSIIDMSEKEAAALIMAARAGWFTDESEG